MKANNWNKIDLSKVDTPALIIDLDMVENNITQAISIAGSADRLRPHVKTHKMLNVAKLQMAKGIYKFKCATIAEAEMLGMAKAPKVLIAYPLQGPKILRFIALSNKYPKTEFSFLVDNADIAHEIQAKLEANFITANVFIDVNNGQDRTGIKISETNSLINKIQSSKNIRLAGIHCYDGHIRMESIKDRSHQVLEAFKPVIEFKKSIELKFGYEMEFVAGGSPSFPVHAKHHEVDCSPGTWIFWDARYGADYPEQHFQKAAVVATRVISKLDDYTYCLDLGHKSIASESPFPRVQFTENIQCEQIGHSEEHLIVKFKEKNKLSVGQLLTAYPFHICPTVALYNEAYIVKDQQIIEKWPVTARGRKITV